MTETIPTYPDLAGKVAVVTGGSGGIGAATCRMLAANGAKVAVNGRGEARIGATVEAMRASGGEAVSAPADCTDLAAVERMRKRVEESLGPVAVVAAFAGGGAPGGVGADHGGGVALERQRQPHRHLPHPQELPARHDRARWRVRRDHDLERGPCPDGRARALRGR
jgi:NAD(P)-dependent dehydrogenase (short-subunit alcohol dehydrogenase family)